MTEAIGKVAEATDEPIEVDVDLAYAIGERISTSAACTRQQLVHVSSSYTSATMTHGGRRASTR